MALADPQISFINHEAVYPDDYREDSYSYAFPAAGRELPESVEVNTDKGPVKLQKIMKYLEPVRAKDAAMCVICDEKGGYTMLPSRVKLATKSGRGVSNTIKLDGPSGKQYSAHVDGYEYLFSEVSGVTVWASSDMKLFCISSDGQLHVRKFK
jgi:hypothetical protein